MQLKGGAGYMRTEPYELIMRDIRIFPIFEGANDVMRSFTALSVLKPLGEELEGLGDLDLTDPVGTLGAWAGYVGGRLKREVRPDRMTLAHDELSGLADPVADQVKRLRSVGEGLLRKHGRKIVDQGMSHKRLADALADVYAQIAVLSRVTSILEDQGVEASGQELLHRRDVLHAGRAPGQSRAGQDRAERRRAHALDRPPGLQARRSTATPCSRTRRGRAEGRGQPRFSGGGSRRVASSRSSGRTCVSSESGRTCVSSESGRTCVSSESGRTCVSSPSGSACVSS